MSRPCWARGTLVLALVLATGCQDYNFNPVGQCLIQPGTRRVTLSNVSTADVLFVVDESGSMAGEQAALRDNFEAFVQNIDAANVARAAAGLEPIDFHLAVTTTSVFWNENTTSLCRNDCADAPGQTVCCTSSGFAVRKPLACSGAGAACPVAGTECRLDCNRFSGAYHCCYPDGTFAGPPSALTELQTCSAERLGTMCGSLETHYDLQGCPSRITVNEWPYPQGDFVSWLNGYSAVAPPHPRVVHFDKELYLTGTNRQGYTRGELIDFFKQNVEVGVCGSGQEQALQAGRLALQKALAGQQRDTRDESGNVVWTPPSASALPGSAPARWPNPNSKIVLVFIGDEDDCSSPQDPAGGVVWLPEPPGSDACQRDGLESTDASIRNKQFPVSEFVSYFTSIGRPVAAAFILPAAQESCTIDTCTTDGLCCHPVLGCDSVNGAQSRGTRLLATARGLSQAGVDVVAGSVCDGNFAGLLDDIAEIVKPPSGLTLPTLPAEDEVTLLRIATASGQTRKVCGRPLAAGSYPDLLAAQATGADWWFTASDQPGPPSGASRNVYINPQGGCIANPGETYSADYLGRLPEGGCQSDDQCRQTLGGTVDSWTCYAGVDSAGQCVAPTPSEPGTCICGSRSKNCGDGTP